MLCNKSFTHLTSLRNHKNVHTGEKSHQCQICGQTFSFVGNLKAHMRSHSDERPFPCPHCPKSFSRTANLKEHIRIHTGKKFVYRYNKSFQKNINITDVITC